jgi:hypothetical protein
MVINFKTSGISRDAYKLAQTPVKLKKIYNHHLHENQENKVLKKKKRVKIYEQVEIKYLQILLIV